MDIIELINSKGTKQNWDKLNLMFDEIDKDHSYYQYFDQCLSLLNSPQSYIKLRAFIIIIKLAQYDINNKINKNIDLILKLLNDNKPAFVRVAITYLDDLVLYKPNLLKAIIEKINNIDFSIYKDSMSPLIKNDFDKFLSNHKYIS